MLDIVRQIKPLAFGVLATVFLYCSGFFVVFTPLPIFYMSMVYGKKIGRITFWAAIAVVIGVYWLLLPIGKTLFTDSWITYLLFVPGLGMIKHFDVKSIQVFGTLYFLYFSLFGIVLGEGMFKKWSLSRWLFSAMATSLFVSLGIALVFNAFGIVNISKAANSYIGLVVTEVMKIQQQAASESMQFKYLADNFGQLTTVIIRVIPAAMLIFTLFIGVCNMLVGGRIARTRVFGKQIAEQLLQWSLPEWFIWLLISTGAVFYVNHYLMGLTWLKYVSLNAAIILGGVYFLQGTAIISFYLGKWKSLFLKIMVYALILLFLQTTALGVILLGVADYWVDFRRLKKSENIKKQNKDIFYKAPR